MVLFSGKTGSGKNPFLESVLKAFCAVDFRVFLQSEYIIVVIWKCYYESFAKIPWRYPRMEFVFSQVAVLL